MKRLLLLALLTSSVAPAAVSDALLRVTPGVLAAGGSSSSSKSSDDEDEEETPPAPPVKPATPPPTAQPGQTPTPPPAEPAKPVAAAPAPPPADVPVSTEAQRLVSGAPLFNPNVAVHAVEKKQFSDRGRGEVVLYPAAPQINGKFTQHFGTAASLVYHLHENFAFQLTPQFNWFNSESSFNQELINKVREQAQAATSLLLVYGLQGGVEVAPLYGKFAFYEGTLAQFSLVLNAGAGIGNTRMQLRAANTAGPDTFGDAGFKFLGSVGGGFRVLLGDRFALRLEVRDLVYTARVDSVDGCSGSDLSALNNWFRTGFGNGVPISSVTVGGGCQTQKFTGTDPKTGYAYAEDIPLALNLVQSPSSDVLNNVGFYAGVSFLF
jgi:outer membrane beta-barrel protein